MGLGVEGVELQAHLREPRPREGRGEVAIACDAQAVGDQGRTHAGAAGRAITRLLTCQDEDERCIPVGRVRVCDSKGVVWPGRPGNDELKEELGALTNPEREQGSLRDALRGAHVFILSLIHI